MPSRLAVLAILCLPAFAQTDPYAGERKGYDDIYSSHREIFKAEPNAFLMRTIAGRKPGRALDVAMGQGRNALWLASQGWDVSGFDISPVAIGEARREAAARKLKVDAVVAPYQEYDWGKEKWDLIVFSYYFPQEALPKVWASLRPGGLIAIETFHLDTAKVRPTGGGFHDNELVQVLKDYRVLQYEDVEDRPDWGLPYAATNRLVRALAQKRVALPAGCEWMGRRYVEGEPICWSGGQWSCGPEGWHYTGRCGAQ